MDWAPAVPMVALSESARAQEKLPLAFVGVVPNGIATSQYCSTSKHRDDYLVWLGRFVPEKGPHLAIEAAQRANVPIVLAGTIDRSLQEVRRYFHEVIEPRIDNEQVKYIGLVNMKQKLNLLSRARGFLNPIEWEEPFGIVMIEAMALGCPVISFARGPLLRSWSMAQPAFLCRMSMRWCRQYQGLMRSTERRRVHVKHNF
jgi:glycosyltransferase involved in cell wall biosynthesis